MQKFGLIKSAKNTTRTVLGAGAFNAEDEDESSIPETLPGRDKRGVALVNQTLSTYNPVNINKTNINVDSSIYDYDAAFEKREEQRASSNLRTHVSAASHASEAPSSNYISDLLKTAQRRDKEREIVHEKKLLRERQAEDAIFGDKPKFVTSAYKQKLEADAAFAAESALIDDRSSDVHSSGMQGFYSGVWNNAVTGKVLGSETGVAEPAATRKRVSRFADAGDDNVMTAVAKAPSPTAVDTLNVVNSDAKDSDAKNSAELLEAERAARMELVAAAKERYLQRRAGRVQ